MRDKQEIITKLDKIVFHDIPVEKISFKTIYSTDFIIDFADYNNEKKDYDYWTIKFIEIKNFKADCLELNAYSALEIFRFDYKLNDLFECKIHFLLGIGQPSFEIEIK